MRIGICPFGYLSAVIVLVIDVRLDIKLAYYKLGIIPWIYKPSLLVYGWVYV